jgi:outer membrane lipoprotein-sorting protein
MLLIGFIFVLTIFIIGCEITEDNIEEVTNHIQSKYDNINTFQATINSELRTEQENIVGTSEDEIDYSVAQSDSRIFDEKEMIIDQKTHTKEVKLKIEFPDKIKYEIPGEYVEVCNDQNKKTFYVTENGENAVEIKNFDCEEYISENFGVIKKLENLFDFNFEIEKVGNQIKVMITPKETDLFQNWTETIWLDSNNFVILKTSRIREASNFKSENINNYNNIELNREFSEFEFDYEFPE